MLQFDFERSERLGFGEAILAEGKTLDDLCALLHMVFQRDAPVLVTRLAPAVYDNLCTQLPNITSECIFNPVAQVLRSHQSEVFEEASLFRVAVVAAGTSDRRVVEEAVETLRHYGISTQIYGDVGVAGLHRLLSVQEKIKTADCIICVAGMDGALASVVSGLFRVPVIGVPTSVGYGTSQGGQAAFLSMLNSCANGLCVMNIDNGFGAAMAAVRLRNLIATKVGGAPNESFGIKTRSI